jgi:hypothetical protein
MLKMATHHWSVVAFTALPIKFSAWFCRTFVVRTRTIHDGGGLADPDRDDTPVHTLLVRTGILETPTVHSLRASMLRASGLRRFCRLKRSHRCATVQQRLPRAFQVCQRRSGLIARKKGRAFARLTIDDRHRCKTLLPPLFYVRSAALRGEAA